MIVGLTSIRMAVWQRWGGFLTGLVLLVTGVWWWIDQDLLLNDPTGVAILLIKLHGIVAAIGLLWLGGLLSTHVRVAWQRRRNIGSGLFALLLMALLCGSGVGLYYASYEIREVLHGLHFWLGLAVALVVPLHVVLGRLKRVKVKR